MNLMLGCGRKRLDNFIHLDADARLKPDLVCKLGEDRIPLNDNVVEYAYANHVLEHIGYQGQTYGWFYFFEELYRVMKNGGVLIFESPMWNNVWSWGDPSHTRALSPESFVFFNQDSYRIEGSIISPFRINCDFITLEPYKVLSNGFFQGKLAARKPLRVWWED